MPNVGMREAAAVVMAALVILIASGGCGGEGEPADGYESVSGILLNVVSSSLTELDEIVVRDSAGEVWKLKPSGVIDGFTPSHLREHMALAQPITVRFHRAGDDLLIDEITD